MPDTTPTLRDRIAAALWPLTDWDGDECNAVAAADAVLAVLPMSGPCTCGGRFPLHHLHADTHEPLARQVLGTPTTDTAPTMADIIRTIHTQHPDSAHCEHDGERWPCPTMAATDAVYGASAPAAPADRAVTRRRLTPAEHDRAWHAIEGSAGEDGADPGTVLNAVLHALRIDPPTAEEEQAASPSRRMADEAQPTEDEALCGNTVGVSGLHYRPCARPAGHAEAYCRDATGQHLFLPATAEDDDPICGDQYDDETCELEPEHAGAHCAGTLCWDYDPEPATAATEEPQP